MSVGLAIHWTFRVVAAGDLFAHADALTEALLKQEQITPGVLDSAVSADRGRGVVEIEVTASGESDNEAMMAAYTAVMAAVHATDGEFVPTELSTTVMAPA